MYNKGDKVIFTFSDNVQHIGFYLGCLLGCHVMVTEKQDLHYDIHNVSLLDNNKWYAQSNIHKIKRYKNGQLVFEFMRD